MLVFRGGYSKELSWLPFFQIMGRNECICFFCGFGMFGVTWQLIFDTSLAIMNESANGYPLTSGALHINSKNRV